MEPKHSFANRWTKPIETHGFISLPTLLLYKRKLLGITIPEMYIILCLESFRWDRRNPWPSMQSIAERARCAPRTARGHISSLEKKGYIKRGFRDGTSTVYSLEPLIAKLDHLAVSSLPPGKKLPPSADESFRPPQQEFSAKEETIRRRNQKETNIKKGGLISLKDLIEKHDLKSNDFGKNKEL